MEAEGAVQARLCRTITSKDLVVSWENSTIATSLDSLKGSHKVDQMEPDGEEQQTRSKRPASMYIENDLLGKCTLIHQYFIPPKGIHPIQVHLGEGIIGVPGCSGVIGKLHE